MPLALRPLILLVLCCLYFIDSAECAEDDTNLDTEDIDADEQAEDDTDEQAEDDTDLSIELSGQGKNAELSIENKKEEFSTEDNKEELSTKDTVFTVSTTTTAEVVLRKSVAKNKTRKSYRNQGLHYRADDSDEEYVNKAFVTFRKQDGDDFSVFVGGCLLKQDAVLTVAKPFFEVKTALFCFKVIRDLYNFHEDIYVVANAESTRGSPPGDAELRSHRRSGTPEEQWRELAYLAHHSDFKPRKMDVNNYAVAVTMTDFEVVKLPKPAKVCKNAPKGLEMKVVMCIEHTAENPKLDPERDLGNPLICVYDDSDGNPKRGILGIAVAGEPSNVYLKTGPAMAFIKEAMIDEATTIIVDAILRNPTTLAIYFFCSVFFHQLMN